jgi:hypothetical protein
VDDTTRLMRRKALTRSFITMGLFALAMVIALKEPLIAFGLVTCIVLTYARPELPWFATSGTPTDA